MKLVGCIIFIDFLFLSVARSTDVKVENAKHFENEEEIADRILVNDLNDTRINNTICPTDCGDENVDKFCAVNLEGHLKTFANDCYMVLENCTNKNNYTFKHDGKCI